MAGIPEEYFGHDGVANWHERFGLSTDTSPLLYLKKALDFGTTENGIFSAKLHWEQMRDFVTRIRALPGTVPRWPGPILRQFFPDVHCVHLSRLDTARQAISYWRAVQDRQWWLVEGKTRARTAADVDLQQLRWFEDYLIRSEQSWKAMFQRNDIPHLDLVYETFVDERDAAVKDILDFLEIEHEDIVLPPTRYRRQADDYTEELLERYGAVRSELPPLPDRWVWGGRGFVPA